ncbi:hypothetical protein D9611_003502 [Ephemerocybe angulata]|uniref:Uncharacterized protein n=1 Tax=Ephemerocybe angulata TaxID=980116 RepID=A0A8H5B5M9_9AGAR|nr:hypothetical protein D9611_003502 [Tulosesus angulatus]
MPQQLLLTLNDVSGFSFSPGPQHPSLASNDAGESPEPKSTMSTTVVDHTHKTNPPARCDTNTTSFHVANQGVEVADEGDAVVGCGMYCWEYKCHSPAAAVARCRLVSENTRLPRIVLQQTKTLPRSRVVVIVSDCVLWVSERTFHPHTGHSLGGLRSSHFTLDDGTIRKCVRWKPTARSAHIALRGVAVPRGAPTVAQSKHYSHATTPFNRGSPSKITSPRRPSRRSSCCCCTCSPTNRKSVDTICDVAKQGMVRGLPWHALQGQTFTMTLQGAGGAGLRESGYRVFAGCPNLVMDLGTDVLLQVFQKGPQTMSLSSGTWKIDDKGGTPDPGELTATTLRSFCIDPLHLAQVPLLRPDPPRYGRRHQLEDADDEEPFPLKVSTGRRGRSLSMSMTDSSSALA